MATLAPSSDQAADMLQKLSLDSQAKTLEISEPNKKPSVNSNNATNGQVQPFDRSVTPTLPDYMDPNICYLPNGYPSTAYYYGGYDGTTNDWDDYSRYVSPDGVEMPPGVYGDNGSLMYHQSYGYTPYNPYSPATSPVPTMGPDGQLYGAQQYQYPTPYFQPPTPTSGAYPTQTVPSKSEISTTASSDQAPVPVDTANGNSNSGGVKGNNVSAPVRPTYQNSSYNNNGSYGRGGMAASGYQDPRFGYDGFGSPMPWLDTSMYTDGRSRPMNNNSISSSVSNGNGSVSSRNQNLRPSPLMGLNQPRPMSGMNSANGYMNRMYTNNSYTNKLYGQYGNTYRSGMGYGSNSYDSRSNSRGWLTVDNKYKPKGRYNGYFGYGNENMDGMNELNRGPRAKSSKTPKDFTPVVLGVKGQNIPVAEEEKEKEKVAEFPDREQYNRADFADNYEHARFFIIKSYSEDDVHKSIKYNMWASTQTGNKKLDAAYQEAQLKSGGCPIFLLFSVNTSGQFVGIAEMAGPVDFNKSLEYWQQDKWIGCFPVKWHIVKDVPNSLLKHIILENNENKPVTNSRDTQEVKLEQGLQLLKIFKEHSSKQCILDDFEFYEDRQKRIQEKKAKQQQFQKQVWEGMNAEEKNKEASNAEAKTLKPVELPSDLVKESTPSSATQTNGVVLKSVVDVQKDAKAAAVANGSQ